MPTLAERGWSELDELINPVVVTGFVNEATIKNIFEKIEKPAGVRLYSRYDGKKNETVLYAWPFRAAFAYSDRDGFFYVFYVDGEALEKDDIESIEATCKMHFEKTTERKRDTIPMILYQARLEVVPERNSSSLAMPALDCFEKPNQLRIAIRSNGLADDLTRQNITNDAMVAAGEIAKRVWRRRTQAEVEAVRSFRNSLKKALIGAGLCTNTPT